jgi:hypothetical protein
MTARAIGAVSSLARNAPGADGWSRAELEEHVRDEHSTFGWLLEATIRRAGFTIEDVE